MKFNSKKSHINLLIISLLLISSCNLNNTEEAIKCYEKALQIDNYCNMSRMNLALLYYQNGAKEKSEKLYQKVIQQEPDFALSYYMLGLLYNELGDAKKSLKTFSNNDRLLYIKTIGLVNTNQLGKAYETATLLNTNYPNNPNYQQLLQNIQISIQNN